MIPTSPCELQQPADDGHELRMKAGDSHWCTDGRRPSQTCHFLPFLDRSNGQPGQEWALRMSNLGQGIGPAREFPSGGETLVAYAMANLPYWCDRVVHYVGTAFFDAEMTSERSGNWILPWSMPRRPWDRLGTPNQTMRHQIRSHPAKPNQSTGSTLRLRENTQYSSRVLPIKGYRTNRLRRNIVNVRAVQNLRRLCWACAGMGWRGTGFWLNSS